MTDHEIYEVLCALAATGQLVGPEKADFDHHCNRCPVCRRQVHDLIMIGLQLHEDAATHASSASMPAGTLERFRVRAVREGITFRSAPLRPAISYALVSATIIFAIVAALFLVPGRRKIPESLAMSTAGPIPMRQRLPVSASVRNSSTHRPKTVRAHLLRRGSVSPSDTAANKGPLTTPQFPWVFTGNYALFGSAVATKLLPKSYPEFSRSQMPNLALFPKSDNSEATKLESKGASNRPLDIASTGRAFDFATNIRQIHFQLPAAQ